MLCMAKNEIAKIVSHAQFCGNPSFDCAIALKTR